MAFTDLAFLFVFLPAALLLYYLTANKGKELILLAVSLFFYACGSPRYMLLLVVSLIINTALGYAMGRLRERRTLAFSLLILGIVFQGGALVYYKYFDFAASMMSGGIQASLEADNLLLPLGLSFYTFKAISYLADVYQGKTEGNAPLTAMVYLSFFGQIQSGPLSRYDTFASAKGGINRELRSWGVIRFMTGFGKKIILANVLSNIVTEVFDTAQELSTPLAWLGAVCFSLQLYYDFSGYSDMAIGISGMFGYECPENFRYPYTTRSIGEFWRRWHITLGAWFRDYIYIPMGGSRAGKARLYLNLLAVWLLTGLWHGANWNFVVWGLGYFVLIAFEKATGIPNRLKTSAGKNMYRIFALLFINFQWVLFRSASLQKGLDFMKVMLVPTRSESAAGRAGFLLQDYLVFLVAAVLFAMPVVPACRRLVSRRRRIEGCYYVLSVAGLCVMFLIALSFAVSGQNNPFLYANF